MPSVMTSHIKCYELCESILTGDEDMEEQRDELCDLCFTTDWEDNLSSAIDDGTTTEFLIELQLECCRRLGEEPEYDMFKEELMKKLI